MLVGFAGMTLVVGAGSFVAADLTHGTNSVVASANLHQLATALDVYYAVHQTYPQTSGGEALVNTLFDENYIRNKPINPSQFAYEPLHGGQDYSLKLAEADAGVAGGSTNGGD